MASTYEYICCSDNIIVMKYKGTPIDSISIISTPKIYLELAVLLLKDLVIWFKNFVLTRGVLLFVITLTWMVISNV